MHKKFAFSLAEVLICLSVIAIMYAILTPIIAKFSPKEKKVLLKKTYGTIESVIYKMINDDTAYPDIDLGFANTAATLESGSHNKFCYYFIDAMNTIEEDFDNCSAKTTDGVSWQISDIKFKNADNTVFNGYSTKITVDVNGTNLLIANIQALAPILISLAFWFVMTEK